MKRSGAIVTGLVVAALWATLGGIGFAQQDPEEEFKRLMARAWDYWDAARYEEMEALGRRLLQLAEGPLRFDVKYRASALAAFGGL